MQPATVLIDSGFASEAAITTAEAQSAGKLTGLAALQREPHGRTVAKLERRAEPPKPPPQAVLPNACATAPPLRRDARCTNCTNKPSSPSLALLKKCPGFPALLAARSGQSLAPVGSGVLDYNLKRLYRTGATLQAAQTAQRCR